MQSNFPLFDNKRDSFINLWYDESMESNANAPQIALHCRVLVELVDSNGGVEQREFTIVHAKLADFKSGLLDENTPLGHALMGHGAGEKIPYQAGDLIEVRILAIADGEASLSSEAAEERRADVQKAAAQSEITNQMIFSTASGSKWGDYEVDMDKLLKDADKKTSPPEK
jgi:hypothetical protein